MKNFLVILALACFATKAVISQKTLGCYVRGVMPFHQIDTSLCTHVYFAIYTPNENAYIMTAAGGYLSDYNEESIRTLKQQNPGIKFFASIGGENSSTVFSRIANDYYLQDIFFNNAMNLVGRLGYDGVDIDWDVLQASDSNGFVDILNGLKSRLGSQQKLLSAVVAGSPLVDQQAYNKPQICRTVDILNMKVFGLAVDGATAINAPLSPIYNMVGGYLDAGCFLEKIVLGMTTRAVIYFTKDPADYSVGTPATIFESHLDVDTQEWYCGLLKSPDMKTLRNDDSPYTYGLQYLGMEWLTYEDQASVAKKSALANEKGLGGIFFYDADRDDYDNHCEDGRYPLLNAAKRGLGGQTEPVPAAQFKCTSNGFFANANDCTKFYQCTFGTQFDLECPPYYGWAQSSKMCTPKYNIPGCA